MKKRTEADVVMLPQEYGVIMSDVGAYNTDIIAATKENIKDLNGARPLNHLYVIIKCDLEEGDTVVNLITNEISKVLGFNMDAVKLKAGQCWKKDCRKIVATTDSTLGLASIRPKFLQAYIKSQRKIKKIMIEIETIAKIKDDSKFIYKGLELPIIGLYMTIEDGMGIYPDGTRSFDLSLMGTEFEKRGSGYHDYAVIEETEFEWMKERIKTREDGSIITHRVKTFSEQDMLVEKAKKNKKS